MPRPKFKPDIVPSSGKRVVSDIVASPQRKEISAQFFQEPPPTIKKPKKANAKFIFWPIAVFAIWILWSTFFGKVEIALTPKSATISLDKRLSAVKDSGFSGALSFSAVSVPVSEEAKFPAAEQKSVEKKAKGTIVIFNKSGSYAQVLVASTRLETPDGKIYRLPQTVVIPGTKTQNGQTLPGSKEVEVFADKPGEEFNIGLSDFTFPGLKGSPKFNTIFARSKTEMQGGYKGVQTVVGKDEAANALKSLEKAAKEKAISELKSKLPENAFLLAPSLDFVVVDSETNPPVGEPILDSREFIAKIKGEARGTILQRRSFEHLLIKDTENSLNAKEGKIRIKNLENMQIKLLDYKFEAESFKISVKGTAEAEAVVNKEEIKSSILKSGEFDSSFILDNFPEVARADISFSPFWFSLVSRLTGLKPSIDIILKGS